MEAPMVTQTDMSGLVDNLFRSFSTQVSAPYDFVLHKWPRQPYDHIPITGQSLPVVQWITEALDQSAPATTQLVDRLHDLAGELDWRQTYGEGDMGAHFMSRYGWTLLVGPGGPIKSDEILAGILVLGPGIEYPVHHHEPEEAYCILAGRGSWKIGDTDWHKKAAGATVYNPAHQPHGMRTDLGAPMVLAFIENTNTPFVSTFGEG